MISICSINFLLFILKLRRGLRVEIFKHTKYSLWESWLAYKFYLFMCSIMLRSCLYRHHHDCHQDHHQHAGLVHFLIWSMKLFQWYVIGWGVKKTDFSNWYVYLYSRASNTGLVLILTMDDKTFSESIPRGIFTSWTLPKSNPNCAGAIGSNNPRNNLIA